MQAEEVSSVYTGMVYNFTAGEYQWNLPPFNVPASRFFLNNLRDGECLGACDDRYDYAPVFMLADGSWTTETIESEPDAMLCMNSENIGLELSYMFYAEKYPEVFKYRLVSGTTAGTTAGSGNGISSQEASQMCQDQMIDDISGMEMVAIFSEGMNEEVLLVLETIITSIYNYISIKKWTMDCMKPMPPCSRIITNLPHQVMNLISSSDNTTQAWIGLEYTAERGYLWVNYNLTAVYTNVASEDSEAEAYTNNGVYSSAPVAILSDGSWFALHNDSVADAVVCFAMSYAELMRLVRIGMTVDQVFIGELRG